MTTEKAILSLDRKETRTIFSKTPNYLPLCPKMSISVHSFQLITKIYADGNAWQQANTQNLLWVKKNPKRLEIVTLHLAKRVRNLQL